MNKQMEGTPKLLPFAIIVQAVNGNLEALEKAVAYFEPYILHLAQKPTTSKQGLPLVQVESEKVSSLEARLVTAIINFDSELIKQNNN